MISRALTAVALVVIFASGTQGQTLYYDTNGATPGTSASATTDLANSVWTTDPTGSIATVGYTNGSDVVFSAGANGTGLQQVTVNGAASADGFTFNNGTVVLYGASGPALSLGAGGLTMNSSDGAATFHSSLGTMTVSAAQAWTENSSQNLNIQSGLTGTGQTITTAGTGTGIIDLNGVVSGSVNFNATSGTSALQFDNTGNSFSGTVSANGGIVTAEHTSVLHGNTVNLSNGGQLNLGNTDGYQGYNNNIVLGTGGGKLAAGIAGSYGVDAVYIGSVTGGTGLTINKGDLLFGGGSSNVGALNIVNSGTRLLAFSTGLFDNSPTINVGAGTSLDTQFNLDTSDAVTVVGGGVQTRGGHVIYRNITFSGTSTIGSDDVGSGQIELTSAVNVSGNLTLDLNGIQGNQTEVDFDNGFTGSGNLTIAPGVAGMAHDYFLGAGNMTGPTTFNGATVYLFNGSGNVFGSSTITMNNSYIVAGGGYANYLNDNHIILGTGTNTLDTGGGIGSISAWFTSGAGSVLHIIGGNSTLVGNANPSSIGTLDVDSGRLFFFGTNGLNLIANNTVVNVNNTSGSNPYGAGVLDFATGGLATVNNEINFASGTGIEMRGSGTVVTLTNANLPTAGIFRAGSDDTPLTSSFYLQKGVALTGDLNFQMNQSAGSSVPVYMNGVISGDHGISTSAGGDGPGILYLMAANTYTGATTVNGATLVIDGDATGAGGTYVVNGGTLVLGGVGTAFVGADLTLNAASSSAPAVFQVGNYESNTGIEVADLHATGATSADHIVGGNQSVSELLVSNSGAVTYAGVLGGAGTYQNNLLLDKQGAGTLTLTGTNTYNGGTLVEQGRLAVNGSILGDVTVSQGAEIGGNGKIGGTLKGDGSVGPGNSPGILTAASVTPTANTSFNFEFTLNGAPDYAHADASGNDVLHLEAGTPFLAALGSGNVINLYFQAGGSGIQGGFFVNGSDSLTAALQGATFNYYVESADGTVTYNGNTYALAAGTESVVAANGAAFADGTANGFTEQFSAVLATPEPSTYGLLGLGSVAFVWLARRKTRFNP